MLLRHGETEWSRGGRHTGRTDIGLTTDGEAEARAAGAALSSHRFALVLVSPLQRARCTAALAGFDDVVVDDDLREWDYGSYEGRTTSEIRAEGDPHWTIWDGPPPDGEPIAHVGVRADRVIERTRATDGDVLCVAHGHVSRVLTARWVGLGAVDARRFLMGTAAINVLGWEREAPAIERLNDQSHLAEVRS